jgi:hypothetical protein
MYDGRSAILRLALISVAWAFGDAVAWAVGAAAMGTALGAIFGAAAYVLTRDGGGSGGGGRTYWRGRPIDRGRWDR